MGDSEGLGSLACCSPWGYNESDVTWRLNNSKNGEKIYMHQGNVTRHGEAGLRE